MKKIILVFFLIVSLSLTIVSFSNAYTYSDKYIGQYAFGTTVLEFTSGQILYALGAGNNGDLYLGTFASVGQNVSIMKSTDWATSTTPTFFAFDSIALANQRGIGASIAVDSLGKIYASYAGGGSDQHFIRKYNADLSIDSTFGTNGDPTTQRWNSGCVLDNSGNIFAARVTNQFDVLNGVTGQITGTSTTALSNMRGIALDTTNNNVYILVDAFGGSTAYILKFTGGTASNVTAYNYSIVYQVPAGLGGNRSAGGLVIDYPHNQLIGWTGSDTTAFGDGVVVINLSNDSIVETFSLDTPGGTPFSQPQSFAMSRQADGIYLVIGDALGVTNGRLVWYYAYIFPKINGSSILYKQPGDIFTLTATGGEGALTWSSGDTSKLVVNPTTGSCTTLSSGTTTVTVTDANNQSGAVSTVTVIITPTSAPMVKDADLHSVIRYEPQWNFME